MVFKKREIIINSRRFPYGTKTELSQDNTITTLLTHDGNLNDEEQNQFKFSVELAKTDKITPARLWTLLKNREGGYPASIKDDKAKFVFTGVYCSNLKAVLDPGIRTSMPFEFVSETMKVKQL